MIIVPTVGRQVQQQLFTDALEQLAVLGEPINRVIEIDLVGGDVTYTLYDLPPSQP